MSIISSRQHAMVKACRAIVRGDDPRLLLDGWHLLAEALVSRIPLTWIAVDRTRATTDPAVLATAAAAGAAIVDVTAAVIDAMSPVRASSGVIAVAERPVVSPGALATPPPALVVAALGVQDPGNTGAIVRSADAAGATGVLLDRSAADPWAWKSLRASMGSMFRLPVLRVDAALDHLREWRRGGVRLVAADPHGGAPMYDLDLTAPLALVVGGEGAGVRPEVLAAADDRVRIPMRAGVESLNVGVAAALLVYEVARQRAGAR